MQRSHLRSLLPALLLLTAPAQAASVRYENASWWSEGVFERGARLAVDGAFTADDGRAADNTVDLGGGWVVPPLAEAHTHAVSDTPSPAAEIADLVTAGILFMKNPNSTAGGVHRGRAAVAESGLPLRALYAGSGVTSPGGHPAQIYEGAGADDGWVPVDSPEALEAAWPRLLAPGPDFVKVYLEGAESHARTADDPAFRGRRGMDPALLPVLVKRAAAEGLSVSAHVRSAEDFRIAVRAGVDEINHLPLEALTPEDAEACASAGVTVVTTVLSHRPVDVPDVSAVHRVNLTRLQAAGVTLALGTDNGQVSLLDELDAVHRLGAIPPADLVGIATTNSIRACLPPRERDGAGVLEPGAEATFLVLDEDPSRDPAAFRALRAVHVRAEAIELPDAEDTPESLAQAMMREVMTNGLDAAIETCRAWFRDGNPDVELSEEQLNAVGYAMMNHGHAEGAVRLFVLNTELFPHSVNALDSLAEAQVETGDLPGARATSKEVLRRLPDVHDIEPGFRELLEKSARERIALAE